MTMHKLCKLLICLWAYSICMMQAEAATVNATLDRSYGFVIGDVIEQRVLLALSEGEQLIDDSLPRLGRQNGWFDLLSVQQLPRNDAQRVELIFRYQWTNAPREVSLGFIPTKTIKVYSSKKGAQEIIIPSQAASISPITKDDVFAREGLEAMRPERAVLEQAETVPFKHMRIGLILAAGCLIAALLLQFIRRNRLAQGPFATAAQALRGLKPSDNPQAQQAMQLVHAAFDRSMNRAVFAHDIERFLQQQPQYRQLEADIRQFFERSSALFFNGRSAELSAQQQGFDVWGFSKAMARIEKRSAP